MIKLGLYGSGNRTRALIDSLIQDEFYTVRAVYDLNRDSAAALASKYGGTVCESADELIGCRDVDAFLISLSPFAHADALRKTIPVGKPVFVEKPVAFSGAEVLELALLAEKHHVPVQVGFMRRYLPETIAALDHIANHDPGRIFCVDCNWFHSGEMEMNFNLHHHPDNFRLKVSQIPYHCCHMLDIMLLLGGPAKRVSSQLIKVTDRPYPSPDDLIANVEFANGANGRFHYSSMVYHTEISYRFHAGNYTMRLNTTRPGIGKLLEILPRPRFRTSRIGIDPDHKTDYNSFNEYYENFCRPQSIVFADPGLNAANENIMYDFVRIVRDGIMPRADLRTASRVQGFAEAIETSGKTGRPVELDPDGLPITAK